jgi:hypothetical protein
MTRILSFQCDASKVQYTAMDNAARMLMEDLDYRWQYGQLGQELFEASEHLKKLLVKGLRATDGHKPRMKFSNLRQVLHLDTIVYEVKSKRICAICEVKATTNQTRMGFKANGACGIVLRNAMKRGIPIFLAVVRLNEYPPVSIKTRTGLTKCRERLLKKPNEYRIEFYDQGQFELRDNRFVILGA